MEFVSISNVVRILFIYSKLTSFLTIFIEQYSFDTLLYQIKILNHFLTAAISDASVWNESFTLQHF